jgi:hypothetical protein
MAFFWPYNAVLVPKWALFKLHGGIANQAHHQTPESPGVLAEDGGGVGELNVKL